MAGGKKKYSDEDDGSASDDEVLSKVKKSPGKKNGAKSTDKRKSGRNATSTRKSKPRAKSTSEEEESQVDESEPEVITDEPVKTSKKSSSRNAKNGSAPKDEPEKRTTSRSRSKKDTDENKPASGRSRRSIEEKEQNDRSESDGSDEDEASTKEQSKQRDKKKTKKKSVEQSENEDEDINGESSSKKPSKPRERKDRKQKKAEVEEVYEVEEILDFKIEDETKYFLIRWKGYDSSVDSWETRRSLKCDKLIANFYAKRPEARPLAHKFKKRKRDTHFNPRDMKKKKKTKAVPKLKIDDDPNYDSDNFDENAEWKVEKIQDVRYHRDGKRDFLIHWEGYSYRSDTWEPEEHLNCKDLIEKFMSKMERIKNVTLKELRPARKPTQHFTLMTQSTDRRLSKRHDARQRAVYYDCDE